MLLKPEGPSIDYWASAAQNKVVTTGPTTESPMTTKIYDDNRLRSKQSPWTDAFVSSFLVPATVPFLLIFAVYMFWSAVLEYQQTAAAGNWQTASGELIQVVAPPYWDNCFEPWVIFLPAAKITYRYEIGSQVYPGESYLKPQGPRFLSKFGRFLRQRRR